MGEHEGPVYVKPSVVLFVGQLDPNLTAELEGRVERRIRATLELPIPVTVWGHVPSLDSNGQDQIKALLSPYTWLSYWDKLENLGHIQPVSQQGRQHKLPELQVIIIVSAAEHTLAVKLADWLRQEYKALASVKLSLVVLDMGIGKRPHFDWPHGPRFWISTTALGNLQVDDRELFEVSQTLVVLLVTSDLLMSFDKSQQTGSIPSSQRWIVIGASTVLADLTSMEEYFVSKYKIDCIRPLMGTTLSAAQASEVDAIIRDIAESYYSGMLQRAATAVKGVWKAGLHANTVDSFVLERGAPLWKVIHQNGLEPSDEISKSFLSHLDDLEKRIQAELTVEANRHLQRLLRVLGYLLNRSTSAEPELTLPIALNPAWPKGIPPVDYALRRLVEILKSPDLYEGGKRIRPNFLFGESYNPRTASQMMMEQVHGYRSIHRIRRMLASVLGTLIYLVPAWPLLYALLLRLFNLERMPALLISTAVVLGAGLVEYFRWQGMLRVRIRAHQDAIELRLRHTLLGIISRLLRDHRVLLYEGMRHRSTAMRQVKTDVETEFVHADLELLEIELNPGGDDLDTRTICELADFEQAGEWAQKATKEIDAEGLANQIIQDGVLPLIHEPGRPVDVAGRFIFHLDELVKKYFKPEDLLVDQLAEEQTHLQKGLFWRWLFDRAHPLGTANPSEMPIEKTFIVLGQPAILQGGFGRGSENWPVDAIVVNSMLDNEVSCLRAIVMTDKDVSS